MSNLKAKILKGDTVLVKAGKYKGTSGKVTSVDAANNKVIVEGVNIVKKHQKPSRANSAGGIMEITKPIHISNVGIVHPKDKTKTSRVGYEIDKKGNKTRVYRQADNKEIK